MEIKGKIHCFFEQSGTFKNEFKKLGYEAFDYDIQNNFGQTDHTDDLFKAIEDAYEGKPSLFDNITRDDLILAFFPCIYFCNFAELNQREENLATKNLDLDGKWQWKLQYSRKRQHFYELALKLNAIVECRDLRMVLENPYGELNYTNHWWFNKPSIIDKDRTRRGDFIKKPTAYWFINCEPTEGFTRQQTPKHNIKKISKYDKSDKAIKCSKSFGVCSEERSMISPDYARNFICDNILGITQKLPNQQLTLF